MKKTIEPLELTLRGYIGDKTKKRKFKKPKERNYWQNFDNVLKEARKIIKKLGYLPSKTELAKLGYNSFCVAVYKHGGFGKIKEDLDLEPHIERDRFQRWDYIKGSLESLIVELGHFPTQKEIAEYGETGLGAAISNQGGLWEVGTKLGYQLNQRKRGYWKDWNNIDNELEILIKKLKHFPSYEEIEEHTPGLFRGLEYHHMTYNELRTKKGHSLSRIPPGYWLKEENVILEVKAFMKKHNLKELPSPAVLENLGASKLVSAMGGRSKKGIRYYRELLGGKNKTVDPGTWQDIDYVLRKARQIKIKNQLKYLPSTKGLREIGEAGLAQAISEYHGGMNSFRLLLGEDIRKNPNGTWSDINEVKKRLEEIIEENNLDDFPSLQTLIDLGEGSIASAIPRFHTVSKIRKLMGYKPQINLKKDMPPKEELKRLYEDKRLSLDKLATQYEVSAPTVTKWLKDYKIHVRSLSETLLPTGFKKPSKEQLEKWIHKDEKSNQEIAKILQCKPSLVKSLIKEYEIYRVSASDLKPSKKVLLDLYQKQRIPLNRLATGLKVSSPTLRGWLEEYNIPIRGYVEARLPEGISKPTKSELKYKYITRQRTTVDIAKELGVSNTCIGNWLKEYNIETRDKRGMYEAKTARKKAADHILKQLDKKPGELLTSDFDRAKQEDGVTGYKGLLGWYMRNYECTNAEARDYLIRDIYRVQPTSKKTELENLLKQYSH